MKVLLFVDGPNGPKCAGVVASGERFALWPNMARHHNLCGWWLTAVQAEKVQAGRWWLVECENAEAGRRVICSHDYYGATCQRCGCNMTVNYGRILAQGGAR